MHAALYLTESPITNMNETTADVFIIQPEVKEALDGAQPVVALESTVITHGLPYPQNLDTAIAMEKTVREGGAIPATIAILDGKIHVGLTRSQLTHLAQQDTGNVWKCSRRDLPLVLAAGADGATTVAATMILAHRAGIEILATGGIGGVHRGHPFDVSADLTELGRTPVTVVCSGAKSILDLPATMEVLETKGVPVIGYKTGRLPAFFSPGSNLPVARRVDEPQDVAAIIEARRRLGLRNGILVTVPVPAGHAFDADRAEAAIDEATKEATAMGVRGAAATPWILKRVAELTNDNSLKANVALLENNGRVAGTIAAALASRRAP